MLRSCNRTLSKRRHPTVQCHRVSPPIQTVRKVLLLSLLRSHSIITPCKRRVGTLRCSEVEAAETSASWIAPVSLQYLVPTSKRGERARSACCSSEPGLQHFTESDQRDIMQDSARGCARHDREVARRAWRTNRMLGARMAWPAKALLPLTPRPLAGMGTAPHSAQEHKALRCQGPRRASGCPQEY